MNDRVHATSNRSLLIAAVLWTTAFEVMTCVLRFGLRLESTRDTASTIGHFTCGLRIHHSYMGAVVMVAACAVWDRFPRTAFWMLAIGLGLFFSDLIHHFLILRWFVGDPQFDLFYP